MNSESDVASPLTESKKGGFFVLFSKFGDKVSCLLKMLLSCATTNKTLRWFVSHQFLLVHCVHRSSISIGHFQKKKKI